MDPITLGLLMGGGTALNEMTTGRQQKKRDAELKANIYRLMAFQPRLNPDSVDIYNPDPIGKGIQGGMAGYQQASNINRNQAMERMFNKEAGRGGMTSEQIQSLDTASQDPGEFVPQPGQYSLLDRPSRNPYSLMRQRGF